MMRRCRSLLTSLPAESKYRSAMSPTAPIFRSKSSSSDPTALPLRASKGEGSRLPIPTRESEMSSHCSLTARTPASWKRADAIDESDTTAAEGMNTARAPVSSASLDVSLVASICTSGFPTPPNI